MLTDGRARRSGARPWVCFFLPYGSARRAPRGLPFSSVAAKRRRAAKLLEKTSCLTVWRLMFGCKETYRKVLSCSLCLSWARRLSPVLPLRHFSRWGCSSCCLFGLFRVCALVLGAGALCSLRGWLVLSCRSSFLLLGLGLLPCRGSCLWCCSSCVGWRSSVALFSLSACRVRGCVLLARRVSFPRSVPLVAGCVCRCPRSLPFGRVLAFGRCALLLSVVGLVSCCSCGFGRLAGLPRAANAARKDKPYIILGGLKNE